jgi:triosephosphate isomerase
MSVMLCIGESLAEFEQDLAGSVCAVQLKKGLRGIKKEDLNRVAIAYEPVWAIGECVHVQKKGFCPFMYYCS